eukprot:1186969-Prorocentrum_minimum.AAC.2
MVQRRRVRQLAHGPQCECQLGGGQRGGTLHGVFVHAPEERAVLRSAEGVAHAELGEQATEADEVCGHHAKVRR